MVNSNCQSRAVIHSSRLDTSIRKCCSGVTSAPLFYANNTPCCPCARWNYLLIIVNFRPGSFVLHDERRVKMKNTIKIMISAVLALFVVVWATPSEAGQRHPRSGDKHQLTHGRNSLSYSRTHGRFLLYPRPHAFKSHRSHRHFHTHHLKAYYSSRNRWCRAKPRHGQLSSIGIHHSRNGTRLHIGVRF